MTDPTKQAADVAREIAHGLANWGITRAGVPMIGNPLDMLTDKNREALMEQAQFVLDRLKAVGLEIK